MEVRAIGDDFASQTAKTGQMLSEILEATEANVELQQTLQQRILFESRASRLAQQATAKSIFGAGSDENMPTAALSADDFRDGAIDILSILVKAELVPSRSEARRAVEQGGVSVDDNKVTDIKATYTKEQLSKGLVVRRGKKAFKKVIF